MKKLLIPITKLWKKKSLISIALLLLLFAVPVMGATYNITATWIANSESDIAGYHLFLGDILIATIDAPAHEWIGEVDVNDGDIFYLSAFDNQENESEKSASNPFNAPPIKPEGFDIHWELIIHVEGGN